MGVDIGAAAASLSKTNIIKLLVLLILCLQNSVYTVLRRYSQGVRKSVERSRIILVLLLLSFFFLNS
jgi:hypothetical protein